MKKSVFILSLLLSCCVLLSCSKSEDEEEVSKEAGSKKIESMIVGKWRIYTAEYEGEHYTMPADYVDDDGWYEFNKDKSFVERDKKGNAVISGEWSIKMLDPDEDIMDYYFKGGYYFDDEWEVCALSLKIKKIHDYSISDLSKEETDKIFINSSVNFGLDTVLDNYIRTNSYFEVMNTGRKSEVGGLTLEWKRK